MRIHRHYPAIAIAIVVGATPAAARMTGINGFSGKNNGFYCSNAGFGCHTASSQPVKPTVRFEGPTQVDPGTEVTYRFVVHSAFPTVQIQAGLDVAASAGELVVVAGQNTRLLFGEITHTGPKDIDQNGDAAWEFIWRTPTTPGEYILFGAGNSVDGSGTVDGDDGNLTTLTVGVGTVVATATATGGPLTNTPTVTPPPAGCSGDCNGDGQVTINELIASVNIALGQSDVSSCHACDLNGDGMITINELIIAVTKALQGC